MTDKLFWIANHWTLHSSAVAQDLLVLEGAMTGGYVRLAARATKSLRQQGVSNVEMRLVMAQRSDEAMLCDKRDGEEVK